MKVYAINDPIRQSVAVYVERGELQNGDRLFEHFVDGHLKVSPVRMDCEPPLYMRIPERIAVAVGEALAPRPEAAERHLDDVIAVRDRLLTLVEYEVTES